MNGYFLTLIILYTLNLGFTLANHGEEKGKYNFFSTLISALIEMFLIYNAIRVGF